MEEKEIAKVEPQEVLIPEVALSETGMLLKMAIDQNLDIDKFERLMEMHRAVKSDQSKDAFNIAFSEMKGELPVITKGAEAKNDDGSTMYMFAPLEDLQEACDPILSKYGFSYHWEEEFIETTNAKRVTFVLEHKEGYSRKNYFDVPDIQGTKRNNAIQVQGIKSTYGKRYTFQSGIGIIIKGEDKDGDFKTFNDAVEYAEDIVWMKSCTDIESLAGVWKKIYTKLKNNNDSIGRQVLIDVYQKRKGELNGTV
ncbi:MAG: ERF family protein [Spirochaetia bacterium]|nr:ERF family protein [Spirochaetia bacterium]